MNSLLRWPIRGLVSPTSYWYENSFIRHFMDYFVKYSIHSYAKSLMFSQFCVDPSSTSMDRARRRSGGPLIDSWWLLPILNGSSHLRDQLSAWWINDLNLCFCLLEAMSFTSSTNNKWLQVIEREGVQAQRPEGRHFLVTTLHLPLVVDIAHALTHTGKGWAS